MSCLPTFDARKTLIGNRALPSAHELNRFSLFRYALIVAVVLAVSLSATARPAAAQQSSAKDEARVDFPKPFNTQDEKDELVAPEELVKRMTLPEGFKATLFAAEPDVQQPVGATFDSRGRLWVAEMYTYAESKVNFETKLRDRIVILEDTDHDGKCDKRKVFWDQGQKLTAVAVGFGGVWALCAPQLLFIPDRDGDDVPDGEPQVVLDGWNDGPVRHNIVNGLTLGPDGWLYGRHGILATSMVGKPGTPDSRRVPTNVGVWRYHPTREVFEVVCSGTTNPWGFDYDDHGHMFFINTVIGHLWHIIPGAYYRRMYGEHLKSHTYQLIDQHADHYHWDTREAWSDIRKGVTASTEKAGGGHAHVGMMIYLGDNWPAEYRGNMFTLNLHGLRINRDTLERHGSGFVGKHAPDFMLANNRWFRGIDLMYGPDGGVYVLDWSDVGECHENDGVHRTSGRIYKIVHGEPAKPTIGDVAKLSNEQLVELQLHRNDWYVRQARQVLQERAAAKVDMTSSHAALKTMFGAQTDIPRRLRALWALYVSGGVNDQFAVKLLTDRNEHVRSWGVRLLVDDGVVSEKDRYTLERKAEAETSSLVRLYMASALQRLPVDQRGEIAALLAARKEDSDDHNIPLVIWYAIEPLVAKSHEWAIELGRRSEIPLVRQLIMRRVAEDIETRMPTVDQVLVTGMGRTKERTADVVRGLADGLRGWRKAPEPAFWKQLQAISGSTDEETQKRIRDLSVVFGDGRALDELRQIAFNAMLDGEQRRAALRTVVESRPDDLLALLHRALGDRALVSVAARGLSQFDNADTPRLLLDRWNQFTAEDQRAALETLVSRAPYARALLDAVAAGKLRRQDLSAWHARQIRTLGDESLSKKLADVWGEVRETAEDKRKLLTQYREQLTPESLAKANLNNGREVYKKTCANCHTLFGEGGAIGPDLTGSNRRNLEYLLENMVDPSASVAADFRVSVLTMHDGRVLSGILGATTARTITLQTATEKLTLQKSDIEATKPTNLSLMPEGQLTTLTAEQIRDLLGYVMAK